MTIAPEQLDRVAAYRFEFLKFESARAVLHVRPQDAAQGVRLALATGAWARATKQGK